MQVWHKCAQFKYDREDFVVLMKLWKCVWTSRNMPGMATMTEPHVEVRTMYNVNSCINSYDQL